MPEGSLSPKLRRTALAALSRDRLDSLTQKFDLNVEDRRAQAAHIDAIVRAKSLDFADVLRDLSRDELKAICSALGLDPSGKEKEPIVQRLLGGGDQKEPALPAPVASDVEARYAPPRTAKKNGGSSTRP